MEDKKLNTEVNSDENIVEDVNTNMNKTTKKHSVLKRLLIVIVVIGCILGGIFYMYQNKPAEKEQEVYAGKNLIQENGKNEVTYNAYDLKNIIKEIAYIFDIKLDENEFVIEEHKNFEPWMQHTGMDTGITPRFLIANDFIDEQKSWSGVLDKANITVNSKGESIKIVIEKRKVVSDLYTWKVLEDTEFYSISISNEDNCEVFFCTTEEGDIKKVMAILAEKTNFELNGKNYSFEETDANYKNFDLEKRYKDIYYLEPYETYEKQDADKKVDSIIDEYAKEIGTTTEYETASNSQNFGENGIYPNAIYGYKVNSDVFTTDEITIYSIHYKTADEAKALIASYPKGDYDAKTGIRTITTKESIYAVYFNINNVYVKTTINSQYKQKLNNFVKEKFNIIV